MKKLYLSFAIGLTLVTQSFCAQPSISFIKNPQSHEDELSNFLYHLDTRFNDDQIPWIEFQRFVDDSIHYARKNSKIATGIPELSSFSHASPDAQKRLKAYIMDKRIHGKLPQHLVRKFSALDDLDKALNAGIEQSEKDDEEIQDYGMQWPCTIS